MRDTQIKTALVSTNSVCQGENVSNLWKPIFQEGAHLDFAYRTFKWDSESVSKAHVHCVIIGFSFVNNTEKYIFDESGKYKAKHINAYLIDADDIFVESRTHALCNVPSMGIGNKPIDGGYYLFTEPEMNDFIQKEPGSKKWFKKWYGAQEFIDNKPRYCLWLKHCPPNELRRMPLCLERIEKVRQARLNSKSAGTRKIANDPLRFHVENVPEGTYIVIPEISSEKRRYVPMGFMGPDVLCSNRVKISQNATLYHFGVLTSNVHMAWMRTVCGRLETRYCYSINIVYNNFPWPTPTTEQMSAIEKTAKGILDARSRYPDSSLADLYDPLTMPPELRKAHDRNNVAVMKAYGFPTSMSEADCVAALMKMYQELTSKEKSVGSPEAVRRRH